MPTGPARILTDATREQSRSAGRKGGQRWQSSFTNQGTRPLLAVSIRSSGRAEATRATRSPRLRVDLFRPRRSPARDTASPTRLSTVGRAQAPHARVGTQVPALALTQAGIFGAQIVGPLPGWRPPDHYWGVRTPSQAVSRTACTHASRTQGRRLANESALRPFKRDHSTNDRKSMPSRRQRFREALVARFADTRPRPREFQPVAATRRYTVQAESRWRRQSGPAKGDQPALRVAVNLLG
jgi:hypothetical protein